MEPLVYGWAEIYQVPLYTVGPRYIKCPCVRLGQDISSALVYGWAKIYQVPLYTVGPRYIKCPCIRLGPDNINHPFLRFGPDNIYHPFLRFGPDISTTLCYTSAEINQMPFCTLRPKNIYYYLQLFA